MVPDENFNNLKQIPEHFITSCFNDSFLKEEKNVKKKFVRIQDPDLTKEVSAEFGSSNTARQERERVI